MTEYQLSRDAHTLENIASETANKNPQMHSMAVILLDIITQIHKEKTLTKNITINIGEDYADCDQFVCEECGLHLQDWVRIDDDDFDDGIVHEYVFKYCPECGAKIFR